MVSVTQQYGGRAGGGKSTMQADLLEAALNRGRRVLVCKRSGDLLYQRHGHLTSITPVRDEPVDLWLDECAQFERYEPQDDDPPPRAA
uniref:Uncharacterized protein n=1 Tax=viral metagenome TaxID=1070528 RepID=A0A6M3LJP1_9ZZZZ